ncbi:hypothetical protein AVEN_195823-1 [Araneus ventricosus]|uniref:Uncharacterized protein n=1 Tax=Araneus ventricosus TaxID=182803 RepID=A0A4Y2F4S8_ARAVE|nr:hypothetical protein AVEN_195823-1 [Araneus ventricosus]
MTRTTPELAPPSPNFRATPTGGRLATTYDSACNRPHTRRIFSGIGFRTCDPPVPRSRRERYREKGRIFWKHLFVTKVRGPAKADARHSILTPEKLPPQL